MSLNTTLCFDKILKKSLKINTLTWEWIIVILVILIVQLYYSVFKRDKRIESILRKFPSPPSNFIAGHGFELILPIHKIIPKIYEWYKVHGGVFALYGANLPYVVIAKAEYAEKILSSKENIVKASDIYDFLIPWLGNGLLISSDIGEKWKHRRKLLTPAFHFSILEEFIHVFNEQTDVLINLLNEECLDGNEFDIMPYLGRCSLDIISETAMGIKINSQGRNPSTSHYVKAVYGMGDVILKRSTRPWLRFELFWILSNEGRREKKYLKILHSFTEKVIAERKREYRNKKQNEQILNKNFSESKRLAFLDLLINASQDGKILTDSDIREETDTFMFEGFDTTTGNLAWTIYLLAKNVKKQRKVQEEIDKIFKNDKSRAVTTKDLSELKYLECCIKESLRIYPSVFTFGRKITTEVKLNDDLTIPKGAFTFIFTYCLHRDESVFKDPDEFKPERFLPENSVGRNPFAYLPFSAGARNCIGQKFALMEEKVILSKILINFNIETMEDKKELIPSVILKPKGGIKVKLTKRP